MSEENENTKTAFSLLKTFPNPTRENQLETAEFLHACSDAVQLFEKFGKAFASLIADMKQNIETLKEKYHENIVKNQYVERMILGEKKETGVRGMATEALLWLARELHFYSLFFKYATSNETEKEQPEEVSSLFRKAYAESLELHHGWLGTQLVQLLIENVPCNKDFFQMFKLDNNCYKKERVLHDMRQYNQELMACVSRLRGFYDEY
ncbi:unnamed protein product [Ceutorhynchus assimilis]|uniref:Glycolipid transfer protein domain-containing protein n=1 Tax=Ceutorhynchus assimilis TaxID=467358 RepID=A0A9N9MC47_9CUCU|nr:unnamed protein product [Ceutorhynchus assimilis]